MTALDYTPEYDNSVFEYHKNTPSVIVPINARYCLTETSAKLLATLFHPAPTIYSAPPIHQANGSPFAFNRTVPWFRFTDGTERNAAVLANYWGMPGVDPVHVLDYVKADIETPVEGQ